MSKRARKLMREAAKYIFLTAAGIILFKYASAYATAQRGHKAVGGEYLLLLLPIIYYAVREMVVGVAQDIAEIYADWKEERRWRTSRSGTDARAAHTTPPREKPTNAQSAMYERMNSQSANDTKARRSGYGADARQDRWEAGNGLYRKQN